MFERIDVERLRAQPRQQIAHQLQCARFGLRGRANAEGAVLEQIAARLRLAADVNVNRPARHKMDTLRQVVRRNLQRRLHHRPDPHDHRALSHVLSDLLQKLRQLRQRFGGDDQARAVASRMQIPRGRIDRTQLLRLIHLRRLAVVPDHLVVSRIFA